jgi:hypothetical protein
MAKPGLTALLMDRYDLQSVHIRHQKLDGVGTDINDRAADDLHDMAD